MSVGVIGSGCMMSLLWIWIGICGGVLSQSSPPFSPLRPLLRYSESSKHYRDPALGPFILVTNLKNGGRLGMFRDEKRHSLWNKRETTREGRGPIPLPPQSGFDRLAIDPFEGRIRSVLS